MITYSVQSTLLLILTKNYMFQSNMIDHYLAEKTAAQRESLSNFPKAIKLLSEKVTIQSQGFWTSQFRCSHTMMLPKMSEKVLLNFSDHLLSLILHNIFSNVFGLV